MLRLTRPLCRLPIRSCSSLSVPIRHMWQRSPIDEKSRPKSNRPPDDDITFQTGSATIKQRLLARVDPNATTTSTTPTTTSETHDIGTVIRLQGTIATLSGLANTPVGGRVLITRDGTSITWGLIMTMEHDTVQIALACQEGVVHAGDTVIYQHGDEPTFPVGAGILGRVLSGSGTPIDGLGPLHHITSHPTLSSHVPHMIDRGLYHQHTYMNTGYIQVDAFQPVARGLRVGLLAPENIGSTKFALDIIHHQTIKNRTLDAHQRTYCIYVIIGKPRQHAYEIIQSLVTSGAMSYTTVIVADDASSSLEQYLAPYGGCTIADYYRDRGLHSIIVYDDLATHGAIYNSLSRSFDTPIHDLSYVHARLLERTTVLSEKKGGGSSTAICLVETQRQDISPSVVETLAGFLDQCIFFDGKLYKRGIYPPISLSSHLGHPSPRFLPPILRSFTSHLHSQLVTSTRTADGVTLASELGMEMEEEDREVVDFTWKCQLLFSQTQPIEFWGILILLQAATKNLLAELSTSQVPSYASSLINYIQQHHPNLIEQLNAHSILQPLSPALLQTMDQIRDTHLQQFLMSQPVEETT